ncbi:hypothetical protein [Gulosibacter sp. 10]|uniref:hypothetical protein n=1 Tax=Gulosibacter sp. 10 TaxID=1255570 RepID=UPI00097F1296|nr:hypothetical protein [Gulosibacter sp. 10]SJM66828.1 Archaeal/vacuolar-type H+-ATPase subunit A [Gulosibacter sp. 10]
MSRITVDTPQFEAAANGLRAIADSIGGFEGAIASTQWVPANAEKTSAGFVLGVMGFEAGLLRGTVGAARSGAASLAEHLVQAQAWYEQVDAKVVETFSQLSDTIVSTVVLGIADLAVVGTGALVGALMTPAGAGILALGVGAAGIVSAGAGLQVDGRPVGDWLGDHAHALANPVTVALVRGLVSGGDEIAAGLLERAGIAAALGPAGAAIALGIAPIRARLTSPQSVAGLVADSIQAVRGDHRFTLVSDRRDPAAAPTSIGEIAESVPRNDAQVQISEYADTNGETVYLVSVTGTTSGEFGGPEPLDNLSNLASYAGQDDEAIGAAALAMEQAGIEAGDAVVFAGYSQGALVVSALAGSGDWDTQSVVLAGSPVHGNDLVGDYPVTQLEHSGDLITGLQGFAGPAAGEVSVVRRDPFPDGVPTEAGVLGPHAFDQYVETAYEYDRHEDAGSVANREAVLDPLRDLTPVATQQFTIEREYPAPEPPAEPGPGAPPVEPIRLLPEGGLIDPFMDESSVLRPPGADHLGGGPWRPDLPAPGEHEPLLPEDPGPGWRP